MQKIINEPRAFVDEMLEACCSLTPESCGSGRTRDRAADAPRTGKVGIVTGGGSGHLPLFMGTSVSGWPMASRRRRFRLAQLRANPGGDKAVDGGAGALPLRQLLRRRHELRPGRRARSRRGYRGLHRLGTDDVASAPAASAARRRGWPALPSFIRWQVPGPRKADLSKNHTVTERAAAGLRAMGVAYRRAWCRRPAARLSACRRRDGDRMGIHGEPGVRRGRWSQPTRSPDSSSTRSWATCPTRPAMRSPCS